MPLQKWFFSGAVLFVLTSIIFVDFVGASAMWSQLYEEDPHECAYGVVEASDGGFVIASVNGLDHNFCLLKIDASGNKQWIQKYSGDGDDYTISVVKTLDGGYALTGYTNSFGAGDYDFWLVKTDINGNMEWNQTYGGPNSDKAYCVIQTSDEGYAIAGHTKTSIYKGHDFWIVKTDSNGKMEWNHTYGRKDDELAYSILEDSEGGYVVAGSSWLIKLDNQGNLEWEQKHASSNARCVVKASDEGYAVFGGGLLIKTDEQGNQLWNQSYTGNGMHGYSNSFVTASDGGYALVIGSQITKIDLQGNTQWTQTYDVERSTEHALSALTETSDGGYILVGHSWSMMTGYTFIWAVKTDSQGIIPEFGSWTVLTLFTIGVFTVAVLRKRIY